MLPSFRADMKCPRLLNSLVLLQFVIVSLASDEEIDKRRTSNVCRASADCPLNAICEPRTGWDGQCVCRPSYFMRWSGRERTCIQIADYGELCYLDQQCTFRLGLHSECQSGQCGCKDGSHYVVNENACFTSSKIGDYCRLTSNCAVDLTSCVKGECSCPFDHHPNWEKNRCLRNVALNETCSHHDECVASGSICYRTCKCRSSHVISQDGERCLPYATSLYQKCQEDSQCSQVAFSYCGSNSTCICQPDHHDINSRCHVTVRLDGTCEDDQNCVIAHSSCINRRCKCDDGYREYRGKFCSHAETVQTSFLVSLLALSFVRLL